MSEALSLAGVTARAIDDAGLVLTELLANAIRHGTPRTDGSLGVAWQITADEIVIEVSDGGPAPVDGGQEAAPGESGGRGLLLVRALSGFELTPGPDGTKARASLRR